MSSDLSSAERHWEWQYLDLMRYIWEQGNERIDRTGVGTRSVFGPQLRFDLSNDGVPLLTTKRVFWKAAAREMLWFLTGETNIRPLLQQLKDGTVHVELEIHDGDGVADRLTDGLLGSASLLASAQLLSRGTGPRIGPVSAPGVLALAVGILTWRRLVRGRAGYQSPLSRVQQLIRPVHE